MLVVKGDGFLYRHLPQRAYKMKDMNLLFLLWPLASGTSRSACFGCKSNIQRYTFFPPIDINTSPLPLLIWCLTKKLAIWSNIEGSHLNACQSPTQGLSMGFSTIILNTHGVHLTADFGTWTQMRCDCTVLTSNYPPTLVGPWLASPFLSLLQWTNPHWAPRGTKGYWLTGFPATL